MDKGIKQGTIIIEMLCNSLSIYRYETKEVIHRFEPTNKFIGDNLCLFDTITKKYYKIVEVEMADQHYQELFGRFPTDQTTKENNMINRFMYLKSLDIYEFAKKIDEFYQTMLEETCGKQDCSVCKYKKYKHSTGDCQSLYFLDWLREEHKQEK